MVDVAVLVVKELHVATSRATAAVPQVPQEVAEALRPALNEAEGVVRWLRISTNS